MTAAGGHAVLPLLTLMSPVLGRGVTKNVLLCGGKSTQQYNDRECEQHCCGMDTTQEEVLFLSIREEASYDYDDNSGGNCNATATSKDCCRWRGS